MVGPTMDGLIMTCHFNDYLEQDRANNDLRDYQNDTDCSAISMIDSMCLSSYALAQRLHNSLIFCLACDQIILFTGVTLVK